ncbi:glycosyltransferase family 2 protein [uncultured Roseovarius sp.]|uniref:glycosyltransferase family 2 protein n=1 Tax=uncultured Roseovarius sp. TaxID=293344 RepID=UPI0025EB1F83|nr:glycosyltransferase family 2 protein [uncultured Roseovarius sp.]
MSLLEKVSRRWRLWREGRRFARSLRHVQGTTGPLGEPGDVVVVALVRDGAYYLDAFLRFYRDLGAAGFVFCDNGSSDGTLERLAGEVDCVVLQSTLPWGEVENRFRNHAAKLHCAGRWCLYADMDEHFTFEGAEKIGLPGLVRYLERQGHTALVAQMVEMFPEGVLQAAAGWSFVESLERFRFHDLRGVERYDYHSPEVSFRYALGRNRVTNDRIKILFGGVRKRVFGEDCCLTKHPLVFVGEGVEPGVHPHASAGVICADFTGLIRHYKFAGDAAARDADTLARGVSVHGEDAKRLEALGDAGLSLWSDAAREDLSFAALEVEGVMVRSDRYLRYLEDGA